VKVESVSHATVSVGKLFQFPVGKKVRWSCHLGRPQSRETCYQCQRDLLLTLLPYSSWCISVCVTRCQILISKVFLSRDALWYWDCVSSIRPSVCLFVTSVDQDHISWKSWKLIAQTISPTSLLFVAQRPSTYSHAVEHGKILGRLEVGWGKVACWFFLDMTFSIDPRPISDDSLRFNMAYFSAVLCCSVWPIYTRTDEGRISFRSFPVNSRRSGSQTRSQPISTTHTNIR